MNIENNGHIEGIALKNFLKKNISEIKKSGANPDNIGVKQINKDIFALFNKQTNNIAFYINEEGETVFDLTKTRGYSDSKEVLNMLGYREILSKNKFETFNLSDIKETKNRNNIQYTLIPGKKPIDVFSKDYLDIWQSVDFYSMRKFFVSSLNFLEGTKEYGNLEEILPGYIKSGYIKLSELDVFRKYGQISISLYEKSKSTILSKDKEGKTIYEKQCADLRFPNNQKITFQELESDKKILGEKLYNKCREIISKRELYFEMKKKIEKEHKPKK